MQLSLSKTRPRKSSAVADTLVMPLGILARTTNPVSLVVGVTLDWISDSCRTTGTSWVAIPACNLWGAC